MCLALQKTLGAGLAEVAARAGFEVVVRSRSKAAAEAMVTTIDKGFVKAIERGKATEDDRAAVLGRIHATDHLGALADCDLIIESVVEDLAVKKALFAELEQIVKPEGILATNTSTLPVVEMAMVTERPDKVVGIHFFNPAPMMKLVEVVRPITASDDTVATDRAGFIVNALLFPYLNNAVRMADVGTASMESIDTAMKGGCNFPMGPFALLDLVGLDTSLAILDALHAEFGDPNYLAVPTLRRMVAAGYLGRKTKRGFYTY